MRKISGLGCALMAGVMIGTLLNFIVTEKTYAMVTNPERGTISVQVKETKNKGLTAIVEGKLRKVELAATYVAGLTFSSPELNIQKSCTVSADTPLVEHIDVGVESFVCQFNSEKGLVKVLYKRFHQSSAERHMGSVEITREDVVLMSGSGEALLTVGDDIPNDPPDESTIVKLLVIGNSGEGNEEQVAVAQAMGAKCEAEGGCTAVLMTGNMAFDTGVTSENDLQWETKFEQPYNQDGLNGLKFYAVPGQKDYCPFGAIFCNGIVGTAAHMIAYSALPVGIGEGTRSSDKFTMPARFYDLELGAENFVHVFGIDTQDTAGGTPNDQPEIMQQRVADSSAIWKIVFGAFPRFSSGAQGNVLQILDQQYPSPGIFSLQETVYCGTDLFIAGHDDSRELFDQGKDSNCPSTFLAVSGASAKVNNTGNTPEGNSLFFDDTTEGFAYLELTETSLLFEFYDKTGTLSFTKTIMK